MTTVAPQPAWSPFRVWFLIACWAGNLVLAVWLWSGMIQVGQRDPVHGTVIEVFALTVIFWVVLNLPLLLAALVYVALKRGRELGILRDWFLPAAGLAVLVGVVFAGLFTS